jgi:RNA polymerase sigma factor (sigma-70 family)
MEAKTTLVEENAGLVWSVARRYFGRGVDPEDLYQLGCLGFLKAIECYDLNFGTQFSTYAVPKIAGEIRRFLRDDGAVKVSRSIKERAASIKMARQRLTGQWNREPTLSELARELALTVEEIAEAIHTTPQQAAVYGNLLLQARAKQQVEQSMEEPEEPDKSIRRPTGIEPPDDGDVFAYISGDDPRNPWNEKGRRA